MKPPNMPSASGTALVVGVRMRPGARTLAVTVEGPTSVASERVKPTIAAFVAL